MFTPTDVFVPPDRERGLGTVREVLIERHRFQLEVARTSSEISKGLTDRPFLPNDAAMLFVFSKERILSFWMKNTLISLDIVFLNSEGVVVDVQTMVTQIGVPDTQLIIYRSDQPARYAVEMNAGLADELGIESGDQALFH